MNEPTPTRQARSPGQRKITKREPPKTPERILDSAIEEFSGRGFSGARTARIARRAGVNIRMLYHYFGGKDALYVAVLEEVLARLRHEELQLAFDDLDPLDGMLRLFDFIDQHFATHPELRCLLAFENLNRGQHLRRSLRIQDMSSPVIDQIRRLLERGQRASGFRSDIDPLHLYVAMVSLAYYGKAHAFTLSSIFSTNLDTPSWQGAHSSQNRCLLAAFLLRDTSGPGDPASGGLSSILHRIGA